MSQNNDKVLKLVDNLWRLKKGIEKNFDYHVSLKMLLSNLKYRAEAVRKAENSGIPKLEKIAAEISEHKNDEVDLSKVNHQKVAQPQDPVEEKGGTWAGLKYAVAAFFVLAIGYFAFDYFSLKNNVNTANTTQQHFSQPGSSKLPQNQTIFLDSESVEKKLQFTLVGSNTVGEKLAPALVKAFIESEYPDTEIQVKDTAELERDIEYVADGVLNQIHLSAHGSSTSFKGMKSGFADIGMASRRIKDKEHLALKDIVGDLRQFGNEHVLAMDGLAVIVNSSNPISKLNKSDIARLFNGDIKNWSELGGADLPVTIYARAEGSGTLDTFKSLVMKPYKFKISETAKRYESSSELSDKVASKQGAIGFIGLPYVRDAKALAVAENSSTMAIYPTAFTISTEDYPLSRRLYFYTKGNEDNPLVKSFVRFALSHKGQEVVEDIGLISQNIKTESISAQLEQPEGYKKLVSRGKRLSLNFRFEFGTNKLDNKSAKDMQRLTEYLNNNRGRRVILAGFCDSVGDAQKNQYLSLKRANMIKQELASRGLSVMKTIGFGESLPLASNDTKNGRSKNRRVEVWVI